MNNQKKNQDNSPNAVTKRSNGALRLMRDLHDWSTSRDEFPCINAIPLDDYIFEWHCNICPDSGDFKDVTFHLIIYFDKMYPLIPPRVKLCTAIPHPNVFGDWICLDMIKREDKDGYRNDKKYQGWTPAYTVTSILMQLESFFFFQSGVDQMDGGGSINVHRSFDPVNFKLDYMPKIETFVCDKCKHCYQQPFPMTLSISRKLGLIEKKQEEEEAGEEKCAAKKTELKFKDNDKNKEQKHKQKISAEKNDDFCMWDGLYHDVEMLILGFLKLNDLIKLKRVAKRLQYLVNNSKIIQKDSIKCWFHRSLMIETYDGDSDNDGGNTIMLCLGVGVNVAYFDRSGTTLSGQLFGSEKGEQDIKKQIGHLKMISSIETTFDLLSSDAFSRFNIRHTVFNGGTFTHFIPLFINEKHGKKCMKLMNKFVLKLWHKSSNNPVVEECHPWLKLYTIANMMKSLIVSVMKSCENKNGLISLHYSTNVLETFFRLHHTLIGIYFEHQSEVRNLLQYQIEMFFNKDKKHIYRNKECIPDFGVFLCYLTLWEHKKTSNNKKYKWLDIVHELLDETFVRQSKWVLKAHHRLIDPKYCSLNERILFRWKTNLVSNRLFMLNCFFFRTCCKMGYSGKKNSVSLQQQFLSYNSNFGFPSDDTLAYKFQQHVKKVYLNMRNFEDMFKTIGIEHPGNKELGLWFIDCMKESEHRGYHNRYYYGSNNCEQERKDWIKQQQFERKQLAQEKQKQQLEKQQQLKQRRLQQSKEARIREERGKTRSEYSLPVEGTFTFSLITRGVIISNNVATKNITRRSCDYVRVYVRLTQSSSEVASLDEMIIDGFGRHATLNRSETDLSDLAKPLYGALFDGFANNEGGTMSRDDLRNYLIYYNVGEENANVHDKVDRIFNTYGSDEDKNKLCKNEFFNFLINAPHNQVDMTVEYPDSFLDGVTIPIKKENKNKHVDVLEPRYYGDFCTKNVFGRLGSMQDIRMKVRGKYIDGNSFEFAQLTKEEENSKRKLLKRVQQWCKSASHKNNTIPRNIKHKFKSRLGIEFSISTIKNDVISNNVTEIALDCDIVRVFVTIVVNKNYKRQVKGFAGLYFDGHYTNNKNNKDGKKCNSSFLSFPDCHRDGTLNIVVHGPINKKNGSDDLVFYGDFSLKTLCTRFGNELKNGISPRVTGLKMNGNYFFCCGGYDCIFYGKCVTTIRTKTQPLVSAASSQNIQTPIRQLTQEQQRQQQIERSSWRSQRQRAQKPKQQAQAQRQLRAPREQRQQQHSQRTPPQSRPQSQQEGQAKRRKCELEAELKEWLKIEGEWIQHNVLNENVSPYSNGERKTIESQIYSGDKDFDARLQCPRMKFNISTIKNGVISHNVNEILLDCEIVRVVVIVSRLNGDEIDFFDEICFDGESTSIGFGQNSNPGRSWTDIQNNVRIHGPFEDKNKRNNFLCYGDFSLLSLCSRFGKDLSNGITPRVRGYTMNGNQFYCCGGYDYLIYGKTKMMSTHRRNDICCMPSYRSSISQQAEQNTEEKTDCNDKDKDKDRECRTKREHMYGMSFGQRKKKEGKKSSDFKSGGWLKISREADIDTSNLYDSIFNKENNKGSLTENGCQNENKNEEWQQMKDSRMYNGVIPRRPPMKRDIDVKWKFHNEFEC